MTFIMK